MEYIIAGFIIFTLVFMISARMMPEKISKRLKKHE